MTCLTVYAQVHGEFETRVVLKCFLKKNNVFVVLAGCVAEV